MLAWQRIHWGKKMASDMVLELIHASCKGILIMASDYFLGLIHAHCKDILILQEIYLILNTTTIL
jgi:hypothetical protein